jgi:glycosyltransferase involved in cell wall biosynthesis
MRSVHAVLPAGVDDPARPSGGNVFDRRVLSGLAGDGWEVTEHAVTGSWPRPEPSELEALDAVLADLPDGSLVLVDGLVASGAAAVLPRAAQRLRLVVLVHMPFGPDRGEELVLNSAEAVITVSDWSRDRLRDWYGLRHVHVTRPGTDHADSVTGGGRGGGTSFVCVAAVHPGKGHDLLFEALAALGDRAWTLTCVGSLDVDPDHVAALQTQVYARSWERRVTFTGPLAGPALSAAYDAADLCVLASRSESYGMVLAEAVAHGLPVVATSVGGVPEAVGRSSDGTVPGLLVPPDDAGALSSALARWLDDPELRRRLTRSARECSAHARRWQDAVAELAGTLTEINGHRHGAEPGGRSWIGAQR